jgi:Do/DeqQ family serine protease
MTRRILSLLLSGAALGAGFGLGLRLVTGADAPVVAGAAALPADFTDVARRSTPAVVNISAQQVYRAERSPFFNDPFFREFFGRDLPFRVPQEERKTSLGSGVIVSADGVIVTNNHVIEKSQQIEITTSDRGRYRAQLVGTDPVTDIAVLRIAAADRLAAMPWGDSSRSRVGEYVLAVGNPFRLNQTVTMGIISATGRSRIGIVDYEDFIQTDAAINPGNSGGALVNTRGELIGINTAIYSETGGYQGIGFAVPANLAKQVVDDILAHGHVRRGWVGITRLAEVTAAMAREMGLASTDGALVLELLRGSPADRGGIQPGDVVVAVDGHAITDAGQLRHDLAGARPGTELRLDVVRAGRRLVIRISVEGAGDA